MYARTSDNNRHIRLAAPSMTGNKKNYSESFVFLLNLKIFLEFLQGQTKDLHIHVERISIDKIPSETNEQISNWLYQRFVTKDK